MTYIAPIDRITQALRHAAELDKLAASGAFPNYDADVLEPILEEAAKLAGNAIAPLNQSGHQNGARLTENGVVASKGFKAAYEALCEGGWIGLPFPEAQGGQQLPRPIAIAVMEMIQAANMSFGLCPMLTFGAIEALLVHGTPDQQAKYLPKLITGEWTGTMNLTEPQAGSDVGALSTKAVPQDDGSYLITGQKIFITWGDHDMTDNIIHMVLARLPDAPAGSKGISLFVVPKVMVNEDGSLGERNALKCIGLEHKIGIHASPTCVMEYENAKGWMIGAPNKGLACMFTMMNSARLQVGLQGAAACEAALQAGEAYARERKQGAAPGIEGAAPIIRHPDVQRTLTSMAATTQAARAICYACASAADLAEHATDDEIRAKAKMREDLLTPIAKAWSTDRGVDVASMGVQIHGGMGFMNETLAAQIFLDSRIAPIYEGTNGIQAMDLVGRKLSGNGGAAMHDLISDVRATIANASASENAYLKQVAQHLFNAVTVLEEATEWMLAAMRDNKEQGLAGATAYLRLAGDVLGGQLLTQTAVKALENNETDAPAAVTLASVFAADTLTLAPGRAAAVSAPAELTKEAMSTLFTPVSD